MTRDITVACVDVGSIRRDRLGWAVVEGQVARYGRNPVDFVEASVDALRRGRRLAVGFECPLYIPCRSDPIELTSRRKGEKWVNWCGGPGGSVLATGLVQVRWILDLIAKGMSGVRGTTRWSEFASGKCRLLVWEAFITSKDGKRPDLRRFGLRRVGCHEHDALSGAATFAERLMAEGPVRSEFEAEPSMSLIGWHLHSTSLSVDRSLLAEPCIVVKTRKRRVQKTTAKKRRVGT